MADLDFSGMFENGPAPERKRLQRVPHSLDVMLVTMVVALTILVPTVWHFSTGLVALLVGIAFSLALFLNQWLMYNSAYSDGFRSGYLTAQSDHADVGFIEDRIDDHKVYTRFGGLSNLDPTVATAMAKSGKRL